MSFAHGSKMNTWSYRAIARRTEMKWFSCVTVVINLSLLPQNA